MKNRLTQEQKDRRVQLIHKDIEGKITEEEREELKNLIHEFFEEFASPVRRNKKKVKQTRVVHDPPRPGDNISSEESKRAVREVISQRQKDDKKKP
jgi:hypothetical protein